MKELLKNTSTADHLSDNLFNELFELKSTESQQLQLAEKFRQLSFPFLSDLSLIGQIYDWFCEINGNNRKRNKNEKSINCRQFIFIILYLYAPATLINHSMPRGLRSAIAQTLGKETASSVSHYAENLLFMYRQYRDFSKGVEDSYLEIFNRLRIKGHLNERKI